MKGVRVQSLLMTPVNLRTAKCQGAQIKVTVYKDSLKVSCRCLELSDSGREETGRGPGTENVLPGLGIYVTRSRPVLRRSLDLVVLGFLGFCAVSGLWCQQASQLRG